MSSSASHSSAGPRVQAARPAGAGSHTAASVPTHMHTPRAPRMPHRLPCRVRLFDPISNAWIARPAQTVNVSQYGLGLQIGVPLPVGSRIEVVTPRFDADPLTISGTVVQSRRLLTGGFEVGVRSTTPLPMA